MIVQDCETDGIDIVMDNDTTTGITKYQNGLDIDKSAV